MDKNILDKVVKLGLMMGLCTSLYAAGSYANLAEDLESKVAESEKLNNQLSLEKEKLSENLADKEQLLISQKEEINTLVENLDGLGTQLEVLEDKVLILTNTKKLTE